MARLADAAHVLVADASERAALLEIPQRQAHRARHLALARLVQAGVAAHQAAQHLRVAVRLALLGCARTSKRCMLLRDL